MLPKDQKLGVNRPLPMPKSDAPLTWAMTPHPIAIKEENKGMVNLRRVPKARSSESEIGYKSATNGRKFVFTEVLSEANIQRSDLRNRLAV